MAAILVTGGSGFIGSALIRALLSDDCHEVLNLDALSYAAQPDALDAIVDNERYRFVHGDICDAALVDRVLRDFRPDALVNIAAESHVDRSIDAPSAFVRTNVQGTLTLLECCRDWIAGSTPSRFRFLQVSTDEVYGDLGPAGTPSREGDACRPGSPYAASKAAADHLCDAWHRTYGFPVMVSHASNTYGAWQFPEKLVPVVICRALAGQSIPVYDSGLQVRDWLYVDDHVRALQCLLENGQPGEHYNIAAGEARTNIALIGEICAVLDHLSPASAPPGGHLTRVVHVADRPGHDWRYAMNTAKLEALGWRPTHAFAKALHETVRFYVDRFAAC